MLTKEVLPQDYDGFDEANETDCLEEFLKLPRGSLPQVPIIHHNLSNFSSREVKHLPIFCLSASHKTLIAGFNGEGDHKQSDEWHFKQQANTRANTECNQISQ